MPVLEGLEDSGDQGIDIVGFITDANWDGGWDNYQCKRYNNPLCPGDIWVEIGKIIYSTFQQCEVQYVR